MNETTKLFRWNCSMAIIQASMAIFLAIRYKDKGLFGKENLYMVSNDKRNTTDDNYVLDYIAKSSDTQNVAAEVVAFFSITAFFHSLYAFTSKGFYNDMIKARNNYLRWFEYSISATLMIRILAFESGIRETNTLKSLTTATIGIMLQGQIVESLLARDDIYKPESKDLRNVIYVATLAGWVMMVGIFWVIIQNFIRIQKDVSNLGCYDSKGVKIEIPSWVVWLVATQLLFYSTFGFIQMVQIFRRLACTSEGLPKFEYKYENYEKYYLIDSLLSKVTLGAILAYGLVEAKNGAYGDFECVAK